MKNFAYRPGSRYPLGATWDGANGTYFSMFSRHADWVDLLLYEKPDSPAPVAVIPLEDPSVYRTFFFWNVYVEGVVPGYCYTWRVHGPNDTRRSGFRFNGNRELLDPWARAVTCDLWDRAKSCLQTVAGVPTMRAMVVKHRVVQDKEVKDTYEWNDDRRPNHPLEKSVIYELHVGGFTRHPSAGVKHPGTFSGIIEKIPYLKALGITHVELLPVMAFDEQDVPGSAVSRGLRNYWGYSTHSFFCPHPGYCISPEEGTHAREFRKMVRALHDAGIGIILDVVFNHTAEGGADGPIINFKGFGNETFYHLNPNDRSMYVDYTGCGNTVNCNHPLVADFILDCLEYWVKDMHVDGFRFDLASVLARGEDGSPAYHAQVPWRIEFSDVLAETTIIAEAWDATGLYQVGAFPGFRWAEWNGRYRDVVRRFVRGDRGLVNEMATRLTGSSDLYEAGGRLPINSINFVTCHDGFTLCDLVSYNQKHNEPNGEDNRDGTNDNLSWNCGTEGETSDGAALQLRRRQARNFLAVLLLSQGVPMLLAGDEVLKTQRGNNNAYCQDNEVSWFDWGLTEKNKDMLRFVQQMIAFRKRHPCLMRNRFLTGSRQGSGRLSDVTWHGVRLNEPLWHDPQAQVLAYTLGAVNDDEEDLHVILNMSDDSLKMQLPPIPGMVWHRAIDTSRPSPQDILEPYAQSPVPSNAYMAHPRRVLVFESRPHRP